jgi:AraC-like DNA-binding protein
MLGRRRASLTGCAGIAGGLALAKAAVAAGFADQSHMARHFKARFGITPGRYARLLKKRSNGSTRVVKPPSHLRRQCRH